MNMGEKLCSTKNVCTCTLCIQSMNAKDIKLSNGICTNYLLIKSFYCLELWQHIFGKACFRKFSPKEWISYDEKPKRLKKSFRNALSNGILVAKIFSYFIKMFNFIVTP